MIIAASAAVAGLVTGASIRVAHGVEAIRGYLGRESQREEVAARIIGAIEEEAMERSERIEVSRTWDRAWAAWERRARAGALVQVLSGIEAPTLRDLFKFCDESMYDLGSDPAPVWVGQLCGLGPVGPTVVEILDQIVDDPASPVDLARPLVSFIEGEVAA